ncbi:transposase [Clostridium sp. LP20]|uniref:transposase n=1 Tax=Clostridium sp. LP20 TaxID=3418665 RepID=UPI003EE6D4F5
MLDLVVLQKRNIDKCPHCKSVKFIKYGFYNGVQRFKCRNELCTRTFSLSSETPFYYSKKSMRLWNKYLGLMLSGLSIRACAKMLNIHMNTSFNWRHKILVATMKLKDPKELKMYIEMGKVFFKENFKGCRKIEKTTRDKVWVINAIDENRNMLSKPVSIGIWDERSFKGHIYNKIDEKSYIYAYGDRYLDKIARKHNIKSDIILEEKGLFSGVNLEIFLWFKKFYGVATKYLKYYLCWFIRFFNDEYMEILNSIKTIMILSIFKRAIDIKASPHSPLIS